MSEIILVRGARQLLTMRDSGRPRRGSALGDLGAVADGALLVSDGKILQAGSSRRIENLAITRRSREIREINVAGRIVLPGFVDSSAHLVVPQGPARQGQGIAGISGDAFWHRVQAIRATPASRLELRAQELAAAMARHGTTTAEGKSGYGLDRTGELKILRVIGRLNRRPLDIVATYYGARYVPPEFGGDEAAYVEWMCSKMLPGIRHRELADFTSINCQDGFELDLARHYLEHARKLGFRLQVRAGGNTRAVSLAVEMEAASVEIDELNEIDVQPLAGSNTIATLLPASGFGVLNRPRASARALIDAGAAVALASGFDPEHSSTYNMQMVLSLACSGLAMTTGEAICAATINSAYALRVARKVGSLDPGKQADFLVLNVQDYRELPLMFGLNHVHLTVKAGAPLYREAGGTWPEA